MVGLVLVSHSRQIADGTAELVLQMAGKVEISAVGGDAEGGFGTDAERIEAALGGIKKRGKAQAGDKTIVDALQPAAEAAKEAAGEGSVAAVLRAAAGAADEGAESTVPMTARRGRASYLGARAQGHQDPGATSTYLLLDAAARALEGAS